MPARKIERQPWDVRGDCVDCALLATYEVRDAADKFVGVRCSVHADRLVENCNVRDANRPAPNENNVARRRSYASPTERDRR